MRAVAATTLATAAVGWGVALLVIAAPSYPPLILLVLAVPIVFAANAWWELHLTCKGRATARDARAPIYALAIFGAFLTDPGIFVWLPMAALLAASALIVPRRAS